MKVAKYLAVGDPHGEPSDLEDLDRLGKMVVNLAWNHGAKVLFLGDQYHHHGVIHAEVQRFWWELFEQLSLGNGGYGAIALRGNHDAPGTAGSKATAMLAHIDQIEVILAPTLKQGILYVPYIYSAKEFVDVCRSFPDAKTVVCHQTFDGSRYENGFYAGDGIDADLIPQPSIISGHLHRAQSFGKVWYPGAPRWRITTDANTERAVWLLTFDESGVLLSREPFDTGTVCRKIVHHIDTPDNPAPTDIRAGDDWRVDIRGPEAWIEQRRSVFEGRAKIRTFKTDKPKPKVRESDGIGNVFQKWVETYTPKKGTDKNVLKNILKTRMSNA